jgi:hypothetical protein
MGRAASRRGLECLEMRRAALFLLVAPPLIAATIPVATRSFVLDGSIAEWRPLPSFGQSSDGNPIWIAQSSEGLIIAGRTAARSARVIIRLAIAESPTFPEIPYDADACAANSEGDEKRKSACMAWIVRQEAYRKLLLKQFRRVWQITPESAAETWALPAWTAMTSDEQEALQFAAPSGVPRRKFRTETGGATTFEILVPWNLFPPANALRIDHLGLDVTVGENPSDAPSDLPTVSLSRPIDTRITECAQPLKEDAYYFLTSSHVVKKTFIFSNHEERDPEPTPADDEVSPEARYFAHFTQKLGPDESICGPQMSYRKGPVRKQYPFRLGPGDGEESNSPFDFPVHRLADGTWLIRYGPDETIYPLSRKAHL